MASIYIASKTKHAARWLALRAAGVPIISTWIDEAGSRESDPSDLWLRCIEEASRASAIIVYHEHGETMKGSLVEIGAALGAGTRVYAVGVTCEQTWAHHPGVTRCRSLADAVMWAMRKAGCINHTGLDWIAIENECDAQDEATRPQSGPSHAPTDPAPPPDTEPAG